MSPEIVPCPKCGTNLENSDSVAGQVVACPRCETQLQMPAMMSSVSAPDDLLPNIDLPPAALGPSAVDTAGVSIQLDGDSATGVDARRRKRTNPWAIVFGVVITIVLIWVGTLALIGSRLEAAKQNFSKQLVGNWEIVPGQSPEYSSMRWDFAFHSNGRMQMVSDEELDEGRWEVHAALGTAVLILVTWSDATQEEMRIEIEGGMLHVDVPGVGIVKFRTVSG